VVCERISGSLRTLWEEVVRRSVTAVWVVEVVDIDWTRSWVAERISGSERRDKAVEEDYPTPGKKRV
jgi:hypothetical protein